MKKLIFSISMAVFCLSSVTSQIKKPAIKKSSTTKIGQLSKEVNIPNIKDLSTKELSELNIPIISITDLQKNAKSITSWKLEPLKQGNTWLSVHSFYGWLMQGGWGIQSMPFFEGREIAKWEPGWLILNFRQSKDAEYRLKIKIQGTGQRGKSLYVHVDDMSGRYPINPDGTVNVVWTASRTAAKVRITIGHLLPNDYHYSDYPQGFTRTMVEAVYIDKI